MLRLHQNDIYIYGLCRFMIPQTIQGNSIFSVTLLYIVCLNFINIGYLYRKGFIEKLRLLFCKSNWKFEIQIWKLFSFFINQLLSSCEPFLWPLFCSVSRQPWPHNPRQKCSKRNYATFNTRSQPTQHTQQMQVAQMWSTQCENVEKHK